MSKQIRIQHMKDMVGFDPTDIIFVTNKWDYMEMLCDSSDEEENISTWNNIKYNLRNKWGNVKEKNIFRTSLNCVITRLLGYI